MHSKKYRLVKIEEFGIHNFMYDDMEGVICYLAYLKPGERGWYLYQTDASREWYGDSPHRVHTSIIKDVEYTDDCVIVTTENTRLTFAVD